MRIVLFPAILADSPDLAATTIGILSPGPSLPRCPAMPGRRAVPPESCSRSGSGRRPSVRSKASERRNSSTSPSSSASCAACSSRPVQSARNPGSFVRARDQLQLLGLLERDLERRGDDLRVEGQVFARFEARGLADLDFVHELHLDLLDDDVGARDAHADAAHGAQRGRGRPTAGTPGWLSWRQVIGYRPLACQLPGTRSRRRPLAEVALGR